MSPRLKLYAWLTGLGIKIDLTFNDVSGFAGVWLPGNPSHLLDEFRIPLRLRISTLDRVRSDDSTPSAYINFIATPSVAQPDALPLLGL